VRQYETAAALLDELREYRSAGNYEMIVQDAAQVAGFQPGGPSGNRIVKDVQDLRREAEKAIARRVELRQLIPQEIAARNYERARQFIAEYDTIATDHAFASDIDEIPNLIVERDLGRARAAMRDGDWDYAAGVSREILRAVSPGQPEARRTLALCRRHRRIVRAREVVLGALVLVLAYVLSAAPLSCLVHPTEGAVFYRIYQPVAWLQSRTPLRPLLDRYAANWGVPDLFAGAKGPSVASLDIAAGEHGAPTVRDLDERRTEFQKAMIEIETDYAARSAAWPGDYANALKDLQQRMQKAGEFEKWDATTREMQRFERERAIPDEAIVAAPAELVTLQNEYRRMFTQYGVDRNKKVLTRSRHYLEALGDLQKKYTIAGKMDIASSINAEIKRVKTLSDEASAGQPSGVEDVAPATAPIVTGAGDKIDQLSVLRQSFEKSLESILTRYRQQQESWPTDYTKAMEALAAQMQKAGDFEGWDAVRQELERFAIDRQLPRESSSVPAKLATLQAEYRQRATQYDALRSETVLALGDDHVAKLSALLGQYTKAGVMDVAASISAEIKRVRSNPEIVAALSDTNRVATATIRR
jgi:hypothetical protein